MKGFIAAIESLAKKNTDFRRVLYTGGQMQLVLMALKPGEEIGAEVHKDRDQFFQIQKGKGELRIDRKVTKIKRNMAVIVPAGARHNIKNTGRKSLRLYTLYAPPEHAVGTVHAALADAQKSTEHFDGRTSEPQLGGARHLTHRKARKVRAGGKSQSTNKTPLVRTKKRVANPVHATLLPTPKRNPVPASPMLPANGVTLSAKH